MTGGEDERPEAGQLEAGYQATRRRQARLGLALTPLERLRWLSETVEQLRRVQGRARDADGDSKTRG